MIAALLDTHTVIWFLYGDARLSVSARAAIDQVVRQSAQVAISSISLVEMAYLEEKGRIPKGTLKAVFALLDEAEPLLTEVPVSREVVSMVATINRDLIPDMPDRVIAATALVLGVPLVSRDGKIRDSHITTIW